MKSYLVIDGYNLLHEKAKQDRKNFKKMDLETERDKLISRVANFKALTDFETELVFDAWQSEGELSRELFSGIYVVYTGKDETADTYIERYLYSRPRLAHTMLVTSDSAVQDMALLTGAERLSSRQFLRLMEEKEKEQIVLNKKKNTRVVNELSEYLPEDYRELFENWRKGNTDFDD